MDVRLTKRTNTYMIQRHCVYVTKCPNQSINMQYTASAETCTGVKGTL